MPLTTKVGLGVDQLFQRQDARICRRALHRPGINGIGQAQAGVAGGFKDCVGAAGRSIVAGGVLQQVLLGRNLVGEHRGVEGHGRADAGLLAVGRDHRDLSDSGKAAGGSPQPRSVNTVIVSQKDFQGIASRITWLSR